MRNQLSVVLCVLLLLSSNGGFANPSSSAAAAATLDDKLNPLTIVDVVNSMKVRDIKRALATRHQFTPAQIDKLLLKQELVAALVQNERALAARGGKPREQPKLFGSAASGRGDYDTLPPFQPWQSREENIFSFVKRYLSYCYRNRFTPSGTGTADPTKFSSQRSS